MEHHVPDIYGEIQLATDPGLAGQVIISQGAGAQALWGAPADTRLQVAASAPAVGGTIVALGTLVRQTLSATIVNPSSVRSMQVLVVLTPGRTLLTHSGNADTEWNINITAPVIPQPVRLIFRTGLNNMRIGGGRQSFVFPILLAPSGSLTFTAQIRTTSITLVGTVGFDINSSDLVLEGHLV